MLKKVRRVSFAVFALFLVFLMSGCQKKEEQKSFPEKQVKIICPWGVGGGIDVISRKIASYGEKYLGQPVIVENKTGGAGTIAITSFFMEKDDGYTMIAANAPLFTLTPHFMKVNYKLENLQPLIGVRSVEFVALTNPEKTGIRNIEDLKAYAAKGNKIKFATTGGPGNDSYTIMSVLFKKLGIPAEAVVFSGGLDAINALVGGHVDVSVGSPPVYEDYIKTGKLASLGTFAPNSVKAEGLPVQKSFKEQGIDIEFLGLDYLAVRKSVDPEKQKVLTEFVKKVYADESFQKFMKEMHMKAYGINSDEILGIIQNQARDVKKYIELTK